MKGVTEITGVILIVLSCASVRAQGSFSFSNLVPGYGIDAPVFDAQGNRLEGANYLAQLWANPNTPDSLQPHVGSTIPFRSGAFAGYFLNPNPIVMSGVSPGAFVWVQVKAWDARLGATYDEVRMLGLGGFGESGVFQAASGGGSINNPPAPLIGLQSFSLREVIPEPSTLLLLLLGLPLLFLRGRRPK